MKKSEQNRKKPGSIRITEILKIIRLAVLICVSPTVSICQTDQPEEVLERVAGLETGRNLEDLAEDLIEKNGQSVNLNTRKPEKLYEVPYLSPSLIKNLTDYRNTYGDLVSIYELLTIPGFDSSVILKIAPFVTIIPTSRTPEFSLKNLFTKGRHDLMIRARQGFPLSAAYRHDYLPDTLNSNLYYVGDPRYYYFRYQFTWYDKIRLGFSGEKDSGEQFFRGTQTNGFDFYGAHLTLTDLGILSRLVIGSFRVHFGQGLTIGSGISIGSIPGFIMAPTVPAGIRPSLGINETTGLRGIGITLRKKFAEVSGFVSYTSRGGTVTRIDSITGRPAEISSLSSSGYHRTFAEIEKRDVTDELLVGGHLEFTTSPGQNWGFNVGLTGTWVKYSTAIAPGSDPYELYRFSGNVNHNLGIDFRMRVGRCALFGELSRSMNGGWAGFAGCTFSHGQNISASILFRNYQPAYQNLFSNAFGQGSLNANEKGIYVALQAAITSQISLSGFVDLFSFPWLKYRVDAATRGEESGVVLVLRVSKNAGFEFRYNHKQSRVNGSSNEGDHLHSLTDRRIQSFRTVFDLSANERLLLKTRIEYRNVSQSSNGVQQGLLLYQEAQLKTGGRIPSISVRLGIFDTDGYDSRFYVYEPAVLQDYAMACLEGKGMRFCTVIKTKPCNQVSFWLQGGITIFADRKVIGTGADLIQGNVKGEVTAQVQIKL